MHNQGRSSSFSSSVDAAYSSPNSVTDDGETTQSSPLSEGSSKGVKRQRLDDAATPASASIGETQAQRSQTSVDDAWDDFFEQAFNERKRRAAEFEEDAGDPDDKVLFVGEPNQKTGQCRCYTKQQFREEFGVFSDRQLEKVATLSKSSDGNGSYQTRNARGIADETGEIISIEPRGFLLRTQAKGKSGFEFSLVRQSAISLQDTIEKYGSENIWLPTREGIYKTPDVYNRSEPDTAGRAFLISTGWPSELVRAEYDRYVSMETYQKLLNDPAWTPKRPFPMDPEKLDTRTLDRTGFSYATPSLPSALKPELTNDGIVGKDLSPVLVDGPITWGFYKGELLGGEKFEAVRNLIPLEHRLVVGLDMSGKDSGIHLRLIDFMRLCKETNVLPSPQQLRLSVQAAAASRLSAESERDPSAPLGATGTSGSRPSRFDSDSPKRNIDSRDRTKRSLSR